MDAAAYGAMPRVAGHCALCRHPHPKGSSNNRKWCDDCRDIVTAQQKLEWAQAHDFRKGYRKTGLPRRTEFASYLTTQCAQQRQIADKALDKGGVKRHCAFCGMWYIMATFDSPCTWCGDALVPLPVTFQPGD